MSEANFLFRIKSYKIEKINYVRLSIAKLDYIIF